jgi:hypothetical protein
VANVNLDAITHRFTCPSTGENLFWGAAVGLLPEKIVALAENVAVR